MLSVAVTLWLVVSSDIALSHPSNSNSHSPCRRRAAMPSLLTVLVEGSMASRMTLGNWLPCLSFG